MLKVIAQLYRHPTMFLSMQNNRAEKRDHSMLQLIYKREFAIETERWFHLDHAEQDG